MRILVLGGTKFVGRALVEAARARGHALTLFNRRQQDAGAFTIGSNAGKLTGEAVTSSEALAVASSLPPAGLTTSGPKLT